MTEGFWPHALRRNFGTIVMVAGVILCVVGLYHLLSAQKIEATLKPGPCVLLILFALGSNLFSAQSWREFLAGTSGHRIDFREALGQNGLVLVGKYVPGKVAGIAARIAANAGDVPVRSVVAATVIETLASLTTAAFVGSALCLFPISVMSTLAVCGIGALVWYRYDAICRFGLDVCARLLHRWLSGARVHDLSRRHMRLGLLQVAGQWLCLSAMVAATTTLIAENSTPTQLAQIAGGYGIAVVVGTAALIFPGGIGPREGAFVWLAQSTIGLDRAVALALLLRIVTTLIDIAGCLGYIYSRFPKRRARKR